MPLCVVFLYVYAFICVFLFLSMHPHTCKGTQMLRLRKSLLWYFWYSQTMNRDFMSVVGLILFLSSVQSLICLTLCNPMDCSTPGFAVHHQLPELAQTHVCQADDAIQPSHPLSSRLISCKIDWLDLLAVQGTLKSLLQHHSSKASILRCSAFFIVQLPHPYMTTGKTIALTRRTFVEK